MLAFYPGERDVGHGSVDGDFAYVLVRFVTMRSRRSPTALRTSSMASS